MSSPKLFFLRTVKAGFVRSLIAFKNRSFYISLYVFYLNFCFGVSALNGPAKPESTYVRGRTTSLGTIPSMTSIALSPKSAVGATVTEGDENKETEDGVWDVIFLMRIIM